MIYCSKQLGIQQVILQNAFIYTTSITLAIGLAYVSFNYYEAYFLKLKDKKFSVDAINTKQATEKKWRFSFKNIFGTVKPI
jgi:peptidoglycan/LPS O-acetylase OafA/YrhL